MIDGKGDTAFNAAAQKVSGGFYESGPVRGTVLGYHHCCWPHLAPTSPLTSVTVLHILVVNDGEIRLE